MPTVKLLKVLNELGGSFTAELDMEKLVNLVVKSGADLTGAAYGAFFYHRDDLDDPKLDLYSVYGVDTDQFSHEAPSITPFLSAQLSAGITRVDDVLGDPLCASGANLAGHMPVRSYLAVPIASRNGRNFGSLLFAHPEPNIFSDADEQIIIGLGSMASVAMDNASLYRDAQREIAERAEAEKALRGALERQKLLLDELNHRVKNTLTTIQSIAIQTRKSISVKYDQPTIDHFYGAFESRLLSLSRAHDLLVTGAWVGVAFLHAIRAAITPVVADFSRVSIVGPEVVLSPNAVVTMNMVFHELATNALKYGALSDERGTIRVSWTHVGDEIKVVWKEIGGPLVEQPLSSGFGTRLIERGAMRELGGTAKMHYEHDGLRCVMSIPVSSKVSVVV